MGVGLYHFVISPCRVSFFVVSAPLPKTYREIILRNFANNSPGTSTMKLFNGGA